MKSRLSIIAAVRWRWPVREPERGDQWVPVVLRNRSAAVDQALADVDQGFKLDGFHLGAILFALKAFLRLLVVVEFRLDPLGGPVKGVDGRPQDLVEVEIEAGVGHGGDQRVEDVGDGGLDDLIFGRDPGVGLARCGTVAIKLQTFDHRVGRRGGVIGFEVFMGVHGMLHRLDRDRRGLHGDEKPTSGPVWQPEPFARASMAKPGYFASRCKAASGGGGK
jgi:hypothetical protein